MLISLSNNVRAENKSVYTGQNRQVSFEPPRGSRPQQTVGGASRGKRCPLDALVQDTSLTPLLPSGSQALTLDSHPTLMVYLPETSAAQGLLVVKDANEDYDYQTLVPLAKSAGISEIILPQEAPALEVNREYQWSLIVMCDGKLRPDSPVVQGSIKRVIADGQLVQQLADADLWERAALYGQSGLWYEMMNSLAELKSNNPQDLEISDIWQNVLVREGLESVAKAEFVD